MIRTVSLFILCLLVALRPLLPESYDSAGISMTAALQGVNDPSPVTTLCFDLLILLVAGGWYWSARRDSTQRYRRTGLEWGGVVLVFSSCLACAFAINKRIAINASIDWLCYLVLTITLVQLLRENWQRRVLLAAILASACVQSVKCYEDAWVGFEETQAYYDQNKEAFWSHQGVELDSPRVELFERRMLAREAAGFFPHSNVAGSYLVLCGLAGIGLAFSQWKRRATSATVFEGIAAAFGAMVMIGAALLTKSRGALASLVLGVVLLLVVYRARRWIDANRKKAWVVGWVVCLVGLIALVGHGLYHGSLPGASLNFRWQYWCASADMIADHALTGVGRENFGLEYLKYKSIDAPEEVANPHNLFVQAPADWGVLGLVGVVLLLLGGTWSVMRPPRESGGVAISPDVLSWPASSHGLKPANRRRHTRDHSATVTGEIMSSERGKIVRWGVALGIGVLLSRIPLCGTPDLHFLYYTTVLYGLAWGLGFCIFVRAGRYICDRRFHTAIAVGMLVFLLHEVINFALFIPGSATTFFALLALTLSSRSLKKLRLVATAPSYARRPKIWALLIVISVGIVATGPAIVSNIYLNQARRVAISGGRDANWFEQVDSRYERAARMDYFDPTPRIERARWALSVAAANEALREPALASALKAVAWRGGTHDRHIGFRRAQCQMYRAKAMHSVSSRDDNLALAVLAAEAVTTLYPNDPAGHILLGSTLLDFAYSRHQRGVPIDATLGTAFEDHAKRAIEAFHEALELDDARPEWERIRGLTDRELTNIRVKLAQAEQLIAEVER